MIANFFGAVGKGVRYLAVQGSRRFGSTEFGGGGLRCSEYWILDV